MVDVKKIVQATTIVTLVILAVKALGFVEKILLAYFWGIDFQVDAYLVAYSIPFSIFVVLREVVRPAFLPVFSRVQCISDATAWRLFSATGTWLVLLLGVSTAIGILIADPLISLAAPGFAGEQHDLAVDLVRLTMPAVLFLGLSTLTTATLHAEKRFVLPALGDVSFRAVPLFFLVVGGIQGLALGVLVGALGKLLIDGLGLRRYWRRFWPALGLTLAPLRTVGRLTAPLLAGFFLSLFVVTLIENAFASTLGEGAVSALSYARKISETLLAIVPYTLGLVLLPFSSDMAARQDGIALARTLTGAMRILTLMLLPVTVALVIFREPFVQLILERGAFTSTATRMTGEPLLFYALGLVPLALEILVVQFYFARQDTLTPVSADVIAWVLNVALIPLLMIPLGLGGIALATIMAKTCKILGLLVWFGRREPAFRFSALLPFAGQMVLASLTTAVALVGLSLLGQHLIQGTVSLAIYLAIGGVTGSGIFLLTAYVAQVSEVHDCWRYGRGWLKSRLAN